MSISLDIFKNKEHNHLPNYDCKILHSASSLTRSSRFTYLFFVFFLIKMLFVNWWLFRIEKVVSLLKLLHAVLDFEGSPQGGQEGGNRRREGRREERREM